MVNSVSIQLRMCVEKQKKPKLTVGEITSPEAIMVTCITNWASLIAQLVKNPPLCRRPWFNSWVGKIHVTD